MKHLINPAYVLLISLILTAFTFAQPPEKAPEKVMMTQAVPSLKNLAATEKFTSPEGRFTIALPKDATDYEAITPTKDSPKETGERYSWNFKEGVFIIEYSDDPDMVIKTEKDYADFAEGMKGGVAVFGGKILSEKALKLGEFRGYEITFEDPRHMKGISRIYIVDGRRYSLLGLSRPDAAVDAIEMIIRALDSFEVTPPKPSK